jgi:hypothetical protein
LDKIFDAFRRLLSDPELQLSFALSGEDSHALQALHVLVRVLLSPFSVEYMVNNEQLRSFINVAILSSDVVTDKDAKDDDSLMQIAPSQDAQELCLRMLSSIFVQPVLAVALQTEYRILEQLQAVEQVLETDCPGIVDAVAGVRRKILTAHSFLLSVTPPTVKLLRDSAFQAATAVTTTETRAQLIKAVSSALHLQDRGVMETQIVRLLLGVIEGSSLPPPGECKSRSATRGYGDNTAILQCFNRWMTHTMQSSESSSVNCREAVLTSFLSIDQRGLVRAYAPSLCQHSCTGLHLCETILETDMPALFHIFSRSQTSIAQIVQVWTRKCFAGVLSPREARLFSVLPVLFGASWQAYFIICLLKHISGKSTVGLRAFVYVGETQRSLHTYLTTSQWLDFEFNAACFTHCMTLAKRYDPVFAE